MKQQKIENKTPARQPTVIHTSTRVPSNRPVRTVIFAEVGGMDPAQFAILAGQFAAEYEGQARGDHYFIPVRDGKIGSDPYFEEEFLRVVEAMCEIKDGKIVLKNGAQSVRIIRDFVAGGE